MVVQKSTKSELPVLLVEQAVQVEQTVPRVLVEVPSHRKSLYRLVPLTDRKVD